MLRYRIYIRPEKKLFVSCNLTLTSFYSKIPTPKVFSPNQHKRITHKIYFLPTYLPYFFRPLQETMPNSFSIFGNQPICFFLLSMVLILGHEYYFFTFYHTNILPHTTLFSHMLDSVKNLVRVIFSIISKVERFLLVGRCIFTFHCLVMPYTGVIFHHF